MNREQGSQSISWTEVEKSWIDLKGRVQDRWDRLTELELEQIGGNYDRLVEKLQVKYDLTREQVEKEVEEFLTTVQPEEPEA
jgi:uncharacterized protein YjbJ (UPF0337 family)